MREIKFRAWCMETMVDVLDYHFSETNPYIKTKGGGFSKNFIPMQYIGRKDKNGVEIYSGDLIQHYAFDEGSVFEVQWDEDNGCWHGFGVFHEWADCEVVGNIYESPELLEEK